ncbi:MAG: hypothetical protein JRI86_15720 [Deltaproteobacteria bacterium]|nr:hypothetical protein [Deltaproteobacteria bacterium]
MVEIECVYCGDFFEGSPRHKNQTACKKRKCQNAKKAAWQRHKMKTDPDYRANQKSSQKRWLQDNPGYWKKYRRKNPEKTERNRILQSVRNGKIRSTDRIAKMDSSLIAKMDASNPDRFEIVGQFWMVPVIAKMDASKVNILRIPTCYP